MKKFFKKDNAYFKKNEFVQNNSTSHIGNGDTGHYYESTNHFIVMTCKYVDTWTG